MNSLGISKRVNLIDRMKPLIDSTYPALMAGLCLTFFAISPVTTSKFTVGLVSTASLFFMISSICIFMQSVNDEWRKTPDVSEKYAAQSFWKLGKWTFFIGIVLLIFATFLVVYNLWISEFLHQSISKLSGDFNSTNLTENNQT